MMNQVDPRHLTLSEKDFMARFPECIPVLNWYDFEYRSMKVDIKECIKNSWGRYYFFVEHHDKLVEERGMYWFALKKKIQHSEPILTHFKWMPAVGIQYTEEIVEVWRRHTTNYEDKEAFRISWKEIWPELIPNGQNRRI